MQWYKDEIRRLKNNIDDQGKRNHRDADHSAEIERLKLEIKILKENHTTVVVDSEEVTMLKLKLEQVWNAHKRYKHKCEDFS